jgi:hypothetical protein
LFSGKWTELEIIILSKRSQPTKTFMESGVKKQVMKSKMGCGKLRQKATGERKLRKSNIGGKIIKVHYWYA